MRSPLFLVLMVFFLSGCGERRVDPDEREAEAAAYVRVLQHLPDTTLHRLSPLDTLFLGYDLDRLRHPAPDSAEVRTVVDSLMQTLTLSEKIGQLFIMHLPEFGIREWFEDHAGRMVEEEHVGGFLVPRAESPSVLYRHTQRLQRMARIPLFFAADFERGAGRYDNAFTELPSNMAIGATGDTLFAAAAGRLTAIESHAIGVNLLFAPVADVNNNPDNPIINIRSYGEDPEVVGQMVSAYVREAQAFGVLATLKHFPGHGNTSTDSHARMGTVAGSRADLDRIELAPYRRAFAGPGAPAAVMTTHLWVKAVDEKATPATLSREVVRGILREELGFQGLVITDDIRMGALSNTIPLADRIVRALNAGVDVILTPADLGRARRVVTEALDRGAISRATVDRAVRNVLTAKARAGLFHDRYADRAVLDSLLSEPRGAYITRAIAGRAVTLLKDDGVLPLRSGSKVLLMQVANYAGSESIEASKDYLETLLEDSASVVEFRLEKEPAERQETRIIEEAREAQVVVLALYQRLQAGRGKAGLLPGQDRLVQKLLAGGSKVVLITFGNPYAVSRYADASVVLVTYDQTPETVDAVADVLLRRASAYGRLPVTADPWVRGAGSRNGVLPDPNSD